MGATLSLLLLLFVAFVPAAGVAGSGASSQTTTVTLAGWASSPEETAALKPDDRSVRATRT